MLRHLLTKSRYSWSAPAEMRVRGGMSQAVSTSVVGVIAAALVFASPPAGARTPTIARSAAINQPSADIVCDGTWQLVPAPNLHADSRLNGVAADSASDAWAVGFAGSSP